MKIGMTELVLILMLALLVLGPDKLPVYMKKLGQGLREFRKYSGELTADIKESVVEPLQEAQKPLKEAMGPLNDLDKDIKDNVGQLDKAFKDIKKGGIK